MNQPHREAVYPDNPLNNRQKIRKQINNKQNVIARTKGGYKFPILETKYVF